MASCVAGRSSGPRRLTYEPFSKNQRVPDANLRRRTRALQRGTTRSGPSSRSTFPILALVGLGLALAAPSVSADVLLLSRNTIAAGSANLPDEFVEGNGFQQTTGFGPVDLTLDGSGVGDVVLHNSANVTVGQTLFILGNGSIGGTGTYSAQTVINGGVPGPIIGRERTARAEAALNVATVTPEIRLGHCSSRATTSRLRPAN